MQDTHPGIHLWQNSSALLFLFCISVLHQPSTINGIVPSSLHPSHTLNGIIACLMCECVLLVCVASLQSEVPLPLGPVPQLLLEKKSLTTKTVTLDCTRLGKSLISEIIACTIGLHEIRHQIKEIVEQVGVWALCVNMGEALQRWHWYYAHSQANVFVSQRKLPTRLWVIKKELIITP